MLTPAFSCSQNEHFVIVVIHLSILCKITDAVFDINGQQFTFYCKPFYLRLRFHQMLREGAGERATFDLEKQELTVYLPKLQANQHFESLDNTQYLTATDKQRQRMNLITEIKSEEVDDTGESEDEDTEFIQAQEVCTSSCVEDGSASACYGFGNSFSGVFSRLDADLVREILCLHNPDHTTTSERRRLRLEQEQQDFDLGGLLFSLEDEDGEVRRLLQYVPQHIRDFQHSIHSGPEPDAIAVPCDSLNDPVSTVAGGDAFEEDEEKPVATKQVEEVWHGNVLDFQRPEAEVDAVQDKPVVELPLNDTPPLARVASPNLAVPKVKPTIRYTKEELDVIMRVQLPALMSAPSLTHVISLTADLLFSEAYDDLFSEGTGCCESVWNICQLSPSLSYLDSPDSLYEACVYFARRVLIYPLHRHPDLFSRIFALVGTRMLLGRQYVVRALLRIRSILSHSEHRHVLCSIFVDPLLAFWINKTDADQILEQAANELHQHATRTQNQIVKKISPTSTCRMLDIKDKQYDSSKTVLLKPLTLYNLDLPIAVEEGDE